MNNEKIIQEVKNIMMLHSKNNEIGLMKLVNTIARTLNLTFEQAREFVYVCLDNKVLILTPMYKLQIV